MGINVGKVLKKPVEKVKDTVSQTVAKVGGESAQKKIGATAIGDMLSNSTKDITGTEQAKKEGTEETEGTKEQSLLEIIKQLLANQSKNDSSNQGSSGCSGGSGSGGCSGGGGCNKTAAANSTANDAAAKQTAMQNLYVAEKNLEATNGKSNPFATDGTNSDNKSQAQEAYKVAKANAQQAGVTDQEYNAYKQQMQQIEQATA